MLVEVIDIEAIDQVQINVAPTIIIAGQSARPPNITLDQKVRKSRPLAITPIKSAKGKEIIRWIVTIRTKE